MSEISEQAVNAALEKAVEFMHFPRLAIDADMRREFKEILVAAFEAQPQQDSPLIAALKSNGAERITQGYRWCYWNGASKEWIVREKKYRQRGSTVITETGDEAEAAKALAGE